MKPASPAREKKLYLENDLKKLLKKTWKSPEKKIYREKYRKPSDYLKYILIVELLKATIFLPLSQQIVGVINQLLVRLA